MYRKKGFYLVVMVCVLATIVFAAPGPKITDDNMLPRTASRPVGGHLDQNYNQLRYLKTTDYGASWTVAQAGDISAFAPYDNELLGNFSAVVMSNGELCYLITLLTAATPGVYALAGPTFTPVLVMAQTDNDFSVGDYNGSDGRCDIGRAPNGDLVGVFVGVTAADNSQVWACKSTNNGASWTSWVIAVEPAIPPFATQYAGYYCLPDRLDEQWAWAIFQDPTEVGYEMKTIRFDHTTTNMGTIVPINDYSGHPYSFMFGASKPIGYDPAANWLYCAFRSHEAAPASIYIYSSSDAGVTWAQQALLTDATHRYPNISMRTASQPPTPFMVYGETVGELQPGDEQCMYMSYDEIGYGGGSWLDPATAYQCQTLFDENTTYFNSLYTPQVWWWDATHGVSSFTGATGFLSGEKIWTNRTEDGGATWIDFGLRVDYIADQINASTMQICEIVGGEAGVAYVVYSGAPGITDEVTGTVGPVELLSDFMDPDGPYAIRAYYWDNVAIKIDDPVNRGPWVNWGDASGVTVAFVNQDSSQADPVSHVGWYYFTIPDTANGGISQGDSIFIYCDGYDEALHYQFSYEQIIVAGVEWLDVFRPSNGSVEAFALHGNYPNPFNPSTTIEFSLPVETVVTLSVYNTLGQMVKTVVAQQVMGAGTHGINFNAADLPTGVYLYRLTAGSFSETRKMLLVK